MSSPTTFSFSDRASVEAAVRSFLADSAAAVPTAVSSVNNYIAGSIAAVHVAILAGIISVRKCRTTNAVLLVVFSAVILAAKYINSLVYANSSKIPGGKLFDREGNFILFFAVGPLLVHLAFVVINLVNLTVSAMAKLHKAKTGRSGKKQSSPKKSQSKAKSSSTSKKVEVEVEDPIIPETPQRRTRGTSKRATRSSSKSGRRSAVESVENTPVPETPRSRAARSRSFQSAMRRREMLEG